MGGRWLRMHALLFAAIFALPLLSCDAGAEKTNDAQVETIVSAIIDAYGGEKALRSIRGYRMKGEQLAVQSHATIRVDRWFGRPDRLRLDLSYPDHHEIRFTDGERGWAGSSASNVRPANPLKLQAMRLQTARLDPPLRLLERLDEVDRRAPDGEGRIVLRLPIDSDMYIDYHIDPKTHRVERMSMWMPGPPEMVFAADYEQFHEIEGVLIPFREMTYAGSTVTSRFQVTEFEWNPKGLDSALSPGMAAWD